MTNTPTQSQSNASNAMFWGAGLLIVFLLVLRAVSIIPDLDGLEVGTKVAVLLAGVAEDFAVVLFAVFVFVMLFRGLPLARARLIGGAFFAVAGLIAVAGMLNLVALHMLNAPLTMEWVRYSDIGNTDVIFDSLLHLLPVGKILAGLAVVGGIYLVARLAAKRGYSSAYPKIVLTLAAGGMLVGFVLAGQQTALASGKLRNPIVAFAQSVFSDGVQDTLEQLAESDDANFGLELPFDRVAGLDLPSAPVKPLKNILFFAFESTPAKQAEGWGGTHPVMPNLRASLDTAIAFDRAYAHVPASNYFLVSAFASMVPELSSVSMTYTRPEFDFNALPKVLNAQGFRTAFFNSSDNRFQNTETFAKASGFKTVKDYRDWTCETGVYEYTSISEKYLNTSSDLCTADRIMEWIEEDPEAPFFAAFRTGMTHYPYFPGENPVDYGVESESYNTYLNALRVGDEAFGKLLAYLDKAGIADETLVVVMGDHGEAFGEHGTYVHAAGINEENVHVPLAFINPQLFKGERSPLIVGLKDVAPTITDLMGLRASESWQGVSLFAKSRQNGVMFFAPWNGFLVGYRHGNEKLIFNANSGEVALYDLALDLQERRNLAPENPEQAQAAQQKLAKLIAAQRNYVRMLVSGESMPERDRGTAEIITIAATGTRFGAAPKVWVKLDGKDVGGFTVSDAPSNENAAVPTAEVHTALERFVVDVALDASCPKRLEIYFLNDNWAGEGKTGDTDLWVRSVEFGGHVYHNNSFREMKEGVGHKFEDYFRYSRNGGAYIDLYLNEACLSETLEMK